MCRQLLGDTSPRNSVSLLDTWAVMNGYPLLIEATLALTLIARVPRQNTFGSARFAVGASDKALTLYDHRRLEGQGSVSPIRTPGGPETYQAPVRLADSESSNFYFPDVSATHAVPSPRCYLAARICSKKARARASCDCPSQNMAALRTAGLELERAT
jgi:hypothetical protein